MWFDSACVSFNKAMVYVLLFATGITFSGIIPCTLLVLTCDHGSFPCIRWIRKEEAGSRCYHKSWRSYIPGGNVFNAQNIYLPTHVANKVENLTGRDYSVWPTDATASRTCTICEQSRRWCKKSATRQIWWTILKNDYLFFFFQDSQSTCSFVSRRWSPVGKANWRTQKISHG